MWHPMASAPQDGSTFLAAVNVYNSIPDKWHWEYALMFFEEGRFQFSGEADTGWTAEDYTQWQLMVPPQLEAQAVRKALADSTSLMESMLNGGYRLDNNEAVQIMLRSCIAQSKREISRFPSET